MKLHCLAIRNLRKSVYSLMWNFSFSLQRSRERDRERRDRYESRDYNDERAGEKWMTDTPTNTIILRGLPLNIEEKDVCLL